MTEYQRFRVIGPGGLRGSVFATSYLLDESKFKLLRLEDGREYMVPSAALEPYDNGGYRLTLDPGQLERYSRLQRPAEAPPPAERPAEERLEEHKVLPAFEEEMRVLRRKVETGRVRIGKHVEQTETVVDEPIVREQFDVRRVPVNRMVDAPSEPRMEGDVYVVPLYEEVMVVEKRLVLREEVHITRRREEVHDPQTVTLRREYVDVDRTQSLPGEQR